MRFRDKGWWPASCRRRGGCVLKTALSTIQFEPDRTSPARVTRLGVWVFRRLICIKRVQVVYSSLFVLVHEYCSAPKIGVFGAFFPLFEGVVAGAKIARRLAIVLITGPTSCCLE